MGSAEQAVARLREIVDGRVKTTGAAWGRTKPRSVAAGEGAAVNAVLVAFLGALSGFRVGPCTGAAMIVFGGAAGCALTAASVRRLMDAARIQVVGPDEADTLRLRRSTAARQAGLLVACLLTADLAGLALWLEGWPPADPVAWWLTATCLALALLTLAATWRRVHDWFPRFGAELDVRLPPLPAELEPLATRPAPPVTPTPPDAELAAAERHVLGILEERVRIGKDTRTPVTAPSVVRGHRAIRAATAVTAAGAVAAPWVGPLTTVAALLYLNYFYAAYTTTSTTRREHAIRITEMGPDAADTVDFHRYGSPPRYPFGEHIAALSALALGVALWVEMAPEATIAWSVTACGLALSAAVAVVYRTALREWFSRFLAESGVELPPLPPELEHLVEQGRNRAHRGQPSRR
ncbi:hypothetical protein V5P93_004485 [Actinokineospora auranticolor]|uniref:Uncharacterized protein n=1 Tax=Actinokineospora auranticolor TaxID=155976 RepID=A0A2S6GTA9_9PSEU|nr:hypothetical protein [Actinokineospora auranticolor]PPK68407.1 hypothetical protein CLV40_105130 [Actinokineospora auranticolor]